MAAAVAARACSILVRGDLIDPEQSTMMISAPLVLADDAASPSAGAVTVMMALTSSPPTARYSFWEISTVKSGWLIGRRLLGIGASGLRRGLAGLLSGGRGGLWNRGIARLRNRGIAGLWNRGIAGLRRRGRAGLLGHGLAGFGGRGRAGLAVGSLTERERGEHHGH